MKNGIIVLGILFFCNSGFADETASIPSFTDEHPSLKKYLFAERDSNIYFGFGVSPLTLWNNRFGFSVNILQVHWIDHWLDWEVISGSFGSSTSEGSVGQSNEFTFRTVPKFRFSKYFSIGAVLGDELISFPSVTAQLHQGSKGTLYTPSEPFSASGLIYGAALCETFTLTSGHLIKLNELFYKENYNVTGTSGNWVYYFNNSSLNQNQDPIRASTVFVVEASFLY